MIKIDVLANTEYQDIYRITSGVLLIINKFTEIYKGEIVRVADEGRQLGYGHGTQKWLKILKSDKENRWGSNKVKVPMGTVTYDNIPVKPTTNKALWTYEIKTTGSSFSGNAEEITEMLSSIQQIID